MPLKPSKAFCFTVLFHLHGHFPIKKVGVTVIKDGSKRFENMALCSSIL